MNLNFQAGTSPLAARMNPAIYTVLLFALIVAGSLTFLFFLLNKKKEKEKTPEWIEAQSKRKTKRRDVEIFSEKYKLKPEEENLLWKICKKYGIPNILFAIKDIKSIDMSWFRSKIGYVQQEAMMFSDTIFNNIAYGKPNAGIEEVLKAADIANAHEFILRHPDAYDTVLGERGVGLSGGERQRISIARAILNNPSVLIFDEATSAVDSETEKLIQDAINNLVKGRTTLMIAHRLSTLKQADKIVVIDKGRILEFGTPDELMAKKGKYYKLVKIQSMAESVKLDKEREHFD